MIAKTGVPSFALQLHDTQGNQHPDSYTAILLSSRLGAIYLPVRWYAPPLCLAILARAVHLICISTYPKVIIPFMLYYLEFWEDFNNIMTDTPRIVRCAVTNMASLFQLSSSRPKAWIWYSHLQGRTRKGFKSGCGANCESRRLEASGKDRQQSLQAGDPEVRKFIKSN